MSTIIDYTFVIVKDSSLPSFVLEPSASLAPIQ